MFIRQYKLWAKMFYNLCFTVKARQRRQHRKFLNVLKVFS